MARKHGAVVRQGGLILFSTGCTWMESNMLIQPQLRIRVSHRSCVLVPCSGLCVGSFPLRCKLMSTTQQDNCSICFQDDGKNGLC